LLFGNIGSVILLLLLVFSLTAKYH